MTREPEPPRDVCELCHKRGVETVPMKIARLGPEQRRICRACFYAMVASWRRPLRTQEKEAT